MARPKEREHTRFPCGFRPWRVLDRGDCSGSKRCGTHSFRMAETGRGSRDQHPVVAGKDASYLLIIALNQRLAPPFPPLYQTFGSSSAGSGGSPGRSYLPSHSSLAGKRLYMSHISETACRDHPSLAASEQLGGFHVAAPNLRRYTQASPVPEPSILGPLFQIGCPRHLEYRMQLFNQIRFFQPQFVDTLLCFCDVVFRFLRDIIGQLFRTRLRVSGNIIPTTTLISAPSPLPLSRISVSAPAALYSLPTRTKPLETMYWCRFRSRRGPSQCPLWR
jgi:hypothetical protein